MDELDFRLEEKICVNHRGIKYEISKPNILKYKGNPVRKELKKYESTLLE